MGANVSRVERGACRDIRVRDRARFHAERRDALGKVYGHRAVGQNEKKHEVDGRYRPPGEEETEAFHHSSRFARGLHPRPFLTVTPPVPFLPRQRLVTAKVTCAPRVFASQNAQYC